MTEETLGCGCRADYTRSLAKMFLCNAHKAIVDRVNKDLGDPPGTMYPVGNQDGDPS